MKKQHVYYKKIPVIYCYKKIIFSKKNKISVKIFLTKDLILKRGYNECIVTHFNSTQGFAKLYGRHENNKIINIYANNILSNSKDIWIGMRFRAVIFGNNAHYIIVLNKKQFRNKTQTQTQTQSQTQSQSQSQSQINSKKCIPFNRLPYFPLHIKNSYIDSIFY